MTTLWIIRNLLNNEHKQRRKIKEQANKQACEQTYKRRNRKKEGKTKQKQQQPIPSNTKKKRDDANETEKREREREREIMVFTLFMISCRREIVLYCSSTGAWCVGWWGLGSKWIFSFLEKNRRHVRGGDGEWGGVVEGDGGRGRETKPL